MTIQAGRGHESRLATGPRSVTPVGGRTDRHHPSHDQRDPGLFYDVNGHETRYTSGQEDIATRIDALLRASRAVRMPPVGQHPGRDPRGGEVAMTMREQHVDRDVLVINNPEGPCPGAYSCQQVLDLLLPPGVPLTVWWPGGEHETFTGRR